MYLRRLELRDFRNYQRADAILPPGMVIFHGANGAGKTNLLEGVCLAASGASPRAQGAVELVRLGEDVGFVRAHFASDERELSVETGLARTGQRQIKINGAVRRRADLIGLAPVVYFSTDDITAIKGEPGARRRLLDTELSCVSRPYYHDLARYRRSLEQRNRLLKEVRAGRGGAEALDAWDRAVARYGARVMAARQAFLASLGPAAAAAHARLTGGARELLVEYRPCLALPDGQCADACQEEPARLVENLSVLLQRVLFEGREADIARGATGAGPHRDDVEVLLGGWPVPAFGSQGEQRTCAIAIRLGLAGVIESMTGRRPLLLLDDVLSELDSRYRAGVFSACAHADQVIITCCDVADIPAGARSGAAAFEVRDGQLA